MCLQALFLLLPVELQPNLQVPGLTKNKKADVTYYLEAKLFDTKNDKLLWTARTKTTKLEDVETEAAVFADLIVKVLITIKVIVP